MPDYRAICPRCGYTLLLREVRYLPSGEWVVADPAFEDCLENQRQRGRDGRRLREATECSSFRSVFLKRGAE